MVSTSTRSFCVECRSLKCKTGTHNKITVHSKWRVPKESNATAWKRIAKGELLWDRRAVERSSLRWKLRRDEVYAKMKEKRRKMKLTGS